MPFVRVPELVHKFAVAVETEYRRRVSAGQHRRGLDAPTDWRQWLTTMFPNHFNKPLGVRHRELWRWTLAITPDERPRPFIGIWDRGSGKSTTAEGVGVALGVRKKRRYGLYVSGTQDQADKHVETMKSMLELPSIDRYYPSHGKPKIGKHGNRGGWRRNRLWTAGDFAVDALGLDVAIRGIKLENQRPDFIILDDIDGKFDSVLVTAKKLETITSTILPARAQNCAVLGMQNLILRDGIFSQLADGRAEFLVDRILSGPFPSIDGLKWEWQRHPTSGLLRPKIIKGKATWEGKPIEVCQEEMDTYGPAAFMKECQHEVKKKGLGIVLRFETANLIDLSDEECRELLAHRTGFGGLDFQLARFAFVLFAVDQHGRAIRIDEYFSQFEGLKVRAYTIHRMCQFYGVTGMMPIWGDAANPQDINEVNAHFKDGWDVCDECEELWVRGAIQCGHCKARKMKHVESKLRCVAVGAENKLRRVAVERTNDALDRQMLLFRTGVEYDWFLGRTTDLEGKPMRCSRYLWEIDNWSFPKMKPGEAQDENPDDNTADGADCIAGGRYALMSHWRKAKLPKDFGKYEDDRTHRFDFKERKFREPDHAVDEIRQQATGRRTPKISIPRARMPR